MKNENDYYWIHKAIISNLHDGDERIHVFVAKRTLALYLDLFYRTISSELFYTIYQELFDCKLNRSSIAG